MARLGAEKKMKATYGVCAMCENLFKHGDYGRKDGLILCESCQTKYDADTDLLKRVKYGGALV